VSAARHRAGGFGRSVAFRTPAPRHAAPARNDVPVAVGAGLALLLGPMAGGVAAVTVNAHRHGSSPPNAAPVASRSVPPTSVPRHGVPTAAKLIPPVLLGLLPHARLSSYCRSTYGPHITAALSDDDDWTCWPPHTGRGLIDMDAVCRWRYGDDGWAGMIDDNDPTTWRCYRDPS
jgi:hypothetical protein